MNFKWVKLPPEVPLSVLQNRLARGEAVNQWAALRAAPTTRDLESVYHLTRTYFSKDCPETLVSGLRQEKGVKGEIELPQRISVLKL